MKTIEEEEHDDGLMPKQCRDDSEDMISIDFDSISQCKKDVLAVATLDFIRGILGQPGGRETLDEKIEELGL